LGDATTAASKNAIRSFLAFPYGVLTLASYLKRFANNLDEAEVLDLNLPSTESPGVILQRKLSKLRPDVVGFSMSYDVSFPWLKSLAKLVKTYDNDICAVAGGPPITTAYAKFMTECRHLDAVCYSEGEVGLRNLIDTDNIQDAISKDPWVTRSTLEQNISVSPAYDAAKKFGLEMDPEYPPHEAILRVERPKYASL
jgi:radical SAM superfamily enzyme YgiQ (UPF0313 family)